MNLLVVTPTYIDPATQQLALNPECADAIKAQRLADGDRFEWRVTTDNPHPIGHENVLHQYQQAQALFLAGEWDALVTIEHDNVLTDDGILRRMADTPADVIYAPYMLRHGSPVLSTWQYIGNRNLGESLTLHPDELAKARASGVWRICGVGNGCTFIRRHVLEQIQFHQGDPRQFCPDIPFAVDCLQAGFLAIGRFDAPVLHIEGARRIHPFEGEFIHMSTYLALQTANALADGRYVRLKAGEEIELTGREADGLVRGGYVQARPVPIAPVVETPIEPISEPIEETPLAKTRKSKK